MDQDKALRIRLVETFNDRAFLKKLGFTRKDIRRVFGAADWKSMLSPLLPIRERLSCARILELCAQRKISVNRLATISGVTQSTLNNIVSGRNNSATVATIKKLCDGLDITLRDFFNVPAFDDLEQEIK